jgi:hypothetical protein
VPAVVVADRTARYAADVARRAYLAGLADANERTAARLRAGVPLDQPSRSAVPGEAEGDGDDAIGEGSSAEGFSGYSPVGHYVPHVRQDADRLTVGEETQRG